MLPDKQYPGWWAPNKKAHYFVDSESLCGKWAHTGMTMTWSASGKYCKQCCKTGSKMYGTR